MKIARVAIDVPLDTLFDYRADVQASDIGCVVVVPFGARNAPGVIVDVADDSDVPRYRLKSVARVLREVPRLREEDLAFMKFAATYYHYALGATIMGALPAFLRRGDIARRRETAFALTEAGADVAPGSLPRGASVQRRLLQWLKTHGAIDNASARKLAPTAGTALRQFRERGWVSPVTQTESSGASDECSTAPGSPLTAEQQTAVAAIERGLGRFNVFLLLGVTGSGKTEVYLHAMRSVLRSGGQVLLLCPEIGLTPQLEATVQARFPGTSLVTLHSGLNETERLERWRAAFAGTARIVLGTRLAVFASIPELGMIIVDEEHDSSFKQFDGLRYSARDLAVVRARQRGVPIVLGSATPSLESYHNARNGRYQLLTLSRRINGSMPRVRCIDTRREPLADGLSATLLAAIRGALERREQSLVFINRRGFAPVLLCRACRWLSQCPRCSANLVLHQQARHLRCHHCGHQARIPMVCPQCGSVELSPLGHGTQRIEQTLGAHFPSARILRIDRDSTRRKHAWPAMRRDITERHVDVLVGTQMLAKGHDFPHLSLVGVVNADSLLYSSDVRAPERLYSLLTQVAGRAGRAETQGEVLLQTDFPGHPLYRALEEHDYRRFADRLLEERCQSEFPPYVHQALLRAEAPNMDAALTYLGHAAHIARTLSPSVTVYDPVPAVMPRLAGRERAQLLVQSASRTRLQQFLSAWHARLSEKRSARARWSLDVDPLEF